jgi:predicted secreted hydrolase
MNDKLPRKRKKPLRAGALLLLLALALPLAARAQGYAGLATDAAGYARVTAPARLAFPRDHGPHPGFRIEWWYVTATLTGADGTAYGAQWTLFRQAMAPGRAGQGWDSPQLWMAHAAVTTADDHRAAETFARGGIGQAGVRPAPFRAWIDDWEMAAAPGAGPDALADLTVRAEGADFGYTLRLATDRPPVPHGAGGFSVKSERGQASYYYSQPFYSVSGTLVLDGQEIAVTGQGWLDREWSSQPLDPDQEGWDWFALHLGSGEKVMVYRLRHAGGSAHLAGTWIAADGTPTPLEAEAIVATPRRHAEAAGRSVPVAWHIAIPGFGLSVDTEPLNAQSWMDTSYAYWEGPIRFAGSHAGRGYQELTGY